MEKPFIRVTLSVAIKLLKEEQHYTNKALADILKVTPLQILYYGQGKTKQPNPNVCLRLYKNFRLQDKPIILDIYRDYEDLKQHHSVYKDREDV